MIRTRIHLQPLLPFTRVLAARLATISGHYQCSLTLEQEGLAVNLKSMLGMLSQTMKPTSEITLVADGKDEEAATKALTAAIKEYRNSVTANTP
ncbi:MAG: HPr family phosphocarrier protein [Bacillota bacterium]